MNEDWWTEEERAFRDDLRKLINQHSMENGSNTPDWVLANYLMSCLRSLNSATKRRDKWFGSKPSVIASPEADA